MWSETVSTDFNGIVLFEPSRLQRRYGAALVKGTDLFTRFMTTDEGDEVLSEGLIVPVLAIDDAGYDVVVRLSSEPHTPPGEIVTTNGEYALGVDERVVAADLAVLKEWWPEVGWMDVNVPRGQYAVTVRGFRGLDACGHIAKAGYEFVLDPRPRLPAITADTGRACGSCCRASG